MKACTFGFSLVVLLLVNGVPAARAEEKNGIQLLVQRKTLDRNDTRNGYYLDRIDRTQGLKATIKNMSFKPMPEGEVEWTIIVRSYYSSSTVQGFSGVEKLKALRPSDTEQMVMGAAQITGWANYYNAAKDKIEYEVIVKQEGVEKIRVQSTAGFEALAKRATIKKVKAEDAEAPAAPR